MEWGEFISEIINFIIIVFVKRISEEEGGQ